MLAAAALVTVLGSFVKGAVGFAMPLIMISGMGSVIAPELAAEIGLGSDDLANISAAWFIAFALAQFPIGLALATALLAAEPPARIHYQGVLRDDADNPLEGGFDMFFWFWSAETGGERQRIAHSES